jgi:NADH:ubiquinone reductase (H+-translocating)
MSPPRVVVVGSGFAGVHAARTLERLLPDDAAELVLISANDNLCYSPLLPEVAAGRLDARRIAVPLHAVLRRTRTLQGVVETVDFDGRSVSVSCGPGGPLVLPWDRLVLTVGSVTRTFPTPGVAEHAHGLKTLAEAVFLHDHVLRQLEFADATPDPEERRARLTFVAVGAGYAGTETAAQLQRATQIQLGRFPRLARSDLRWVLVDLAEAVLPELGPRLGRAALSVIRSRGMEVRLGTTVSAMTDREVTFSDGTTLPCRTVLWTVGVTPPPLVRALGLPVSRGRVRVDDELRLREHVWAAGDAAAARDPFSDGGNDYPPTAQHAQRQGVAIARNVAASLGYGRSRRYRHRDLGLVADLGGTDAVARPLGVPLTGLVAKAVTKGYHLYALPSAANRLRVGTDWALNLVSRPIVAQLGLVDPAEASLAAERHGLREA